MDTFKKQDGLRPYFESAYGYAVFPAIAKAGFGVGAAGGQGDVYINNLDGTETKIGTSVMMQVSLGFQFGGQVYSEIIFFETQAAFETFVSGNFEFGADANVVALTASASASASTMGHQGVKGGIMADQQKSLRPCVPTTESYSKGMSVFTVALGGLMYQATISGQKFTYQALG